MASSASNVRKTTIFIKSAICAATLVQRVFLLRRVLLLRTYLSLIR